MRVTISLDDDLLRQARELSGLSEVSALVGEALTVLVKRQSARRLARMGGSQIAGTGAPATMALALALGLSVSRRGEFEPR